VGAEQEPARVARINEQGVVIGSVGEAGGAPRVAAAAEAEQRDSEGDSNDADCGKEIEEQSGRRRLGALLRALHLPPLRRARLRLCWHLVPPSEIQRAIRARGQARRGPISEEEALKFLRRGAAKRAPLLRDEEGDEQKRRERVCPDLDHRRERRSRGERSIDGLHRMLGRAGTRNRNEHHQQDEQEDEDDERHPLAQALDARHRLRIARHPSRCGRGSVCTRDRPSVIMQLMARRSQLAGSRCRLE
jgi:hypothetical protein